MILIKEKVKESVFFLFLVLVCFILSLEMVHYFKQKWIDCEDTWEHEKWDFNLALKKCYDAFGNNFTQYPLNTGRKCVDWRPYKRSIYVLCPRGNVVKVMRKVFRMIAFWHSSYISFPAGILFIQSQQWKHQNVQNLFKIENKDRTTLLMLIWRLFCWLLNKFHTLLWCFCYLLLNVSWESLNLMTYVWRIFR